MDVQGAFPTRELAAGEGAQTFTEEQHQAIVAATVAREVASRDEQIRDLSSQLTALATEKATALAAVDVAGAAKETAERELAEFKAGIEQAAAVEGRKGECVAKMRTILPDKPDEYFTGRALAWAEKTPEEFDNHFKEMAEAVGGLPGETVTPKETAMAGTPVRKAKPTATGGASFFSAFKRGA